MKENKLRKITVATYQSEDAIRSLYFPNTKRFKAKINLGFHQHHVLHALLEHFAREAEVSNGLDFNKMNDEHYGYHVTDLGYEDRG